MARDLDQHDFDGFVDESVRTVPCRRGPTRACRRGVTSACCWSAAGAGARWNAYSRGFRTTVGSSSV